MNTEEFIKHLKEEIQKQEQRHKEQMEALMKLVTEQKPADASKVTWPAFPQFEPSTELWTDYWARFVTFTEANSVPEDKKAHVFLTNQSPVVYKLLANLAGQQTPPKTVNELTLTEICDFMKEQYHPKRFTVRERFKFWSNMDRKPGETIQGLVARIRQDAITCDFPSIKDPLDEAMRTRFICSINNEAVLKALFKVKDDELTFARAIEIATETEDAAKVAKETVYGQKANSSLLKVQKNRSLE